ncbi:MAG: T9SS type A sorting domain-containing protein, partial [Bacteroidetes bacterium]|nr:T9SS type A sorting domain-containing protein [Bacteroidota bacterium]
KDRINDYEVLQNYPNPFTDRTKIEYSIKKNAPVSVNIYDIIGRMIKSITSINIGYQGTHHVFWDGTDNNNRKVAYGVYFYRITGLNGSQTKKMIFLSNSDFSGTVYNMTYSKNIENKMTLSFNQEDSQSYNIHVENTDSTMPRIIGVDQNNVILSSDSTLNFEAHETLSKYTSIHDIEFSDSLIGWLVTREPGSIYKTIDGGKVWIGLKTGNSKNLYSISVLNKDSIIAVGDTTLYSTDGGKSWTGLTNPSPFQLSEVKFVNPSNIWAVGGSIPIVGQKSNVILHTTNMGVDWKVAYSSDEGSLSGVSFKGHHGWVVGNTGYDNFGVPLILHTTNNGESWIKQTTPSQVQAPVSKVQCIDSLIGFTVGYAGVLKTTNGGINWEWVYHNFGPPFWNLSVINDQEIWINRGTNILSSTNGGQSWQQIWQRDPTNTFTIETVYFVNSSIGWAVGSRGTILKYESGNWIDWHR